MGTAAPSFCAFMPLFRENAPKKGGHHERRTAAQLPQGQLRRTPEHPDPRPAPAAAGAQQGSAHQSGAPDAL